MVDSGDSGTFGELLPQAELDRSSGATEPVTDFKPWHLPRKQHVRLGQWNVAIEGLIDELVERPTLKYLCLPGEDLLDIGTVADLCERKGRKLRYLGFDTDMQRPNISTQRLASRQIISQRGSVEQESVIVPDNFASIGNPNSQGYRSVKDGGTYDVVNLDLCDSFTSSASTLHNALMQILTHQFNSRAQSWLLFLTTRSEIDGVADAERDVYLNLLARNASQSAAFLGLVGEILGQQLQGPPLADALREHCRGRSDLSGRLLSLGIGKWLASISQAPPAWRVDLLSVWSYRTGMTTPRAAEYAREPPNLFSLVFKFKKIAIGRADANGLATEIPGGQVPSEIQLAEKMASCVRNHTKDVDTALATDQDLLNRMQSECEAHLTVRNYSVPHYREWLKPSFEAAKNTLEPATSASGP